MKVKGGREEGGGKLAAAVVVVEERKERRALQCANASAGASASAAKAGRVERRDQLTRDALCPWANRQVDRCGKFLR